MINTLTKEDLGKYRHHLTVKELKDFIEKHKIPDDAVVMIQRIEDRYFENHGWGVYKKGGEFYHSQLRYNKEMKEEIARREKGEEPKYSMEDPSVYICEDEEELDQLKEQYHPASSPVFYEDEKHLFIDLHY